MNHTTKLNAALEPLDARARMFRGEGDLQALVELHTVCSRADDEEQVDTLEQARNWLANYDRTKGDPTTDLVLVEAHGVLIAQGETDWWTNYDGEWLYGVGGWVHPDWRRKGIGRAVLHWNQARAREVAASHAAERGRACAYITTGTLDKNAGAVALYTNEGYAPVRHWYTMLRDLSVPIPDMPLVDAVEVRPVRCDQVRQVLDARNEAFRDHWGHHEMTENDIQNFINWPYFNQDIWVIAWQGDEVVGGCVNAIVSAENEVLGQKRAWLGAIFVRKPWRKRGIAKATMTKSMRLFKDMGMTEAALGVDTHNPNGALHLYQSLGFWVHKSGTRYRKPLA